MPVLLYGLDVCPVNVSDMRSLEFTCTLKRLMIKLFRTYDSGVINSCTVYQQLVNLLINVKLDFYRNVGLICRRIYCSRLPVAVMWSTAVGMYRPIML